MYKLEGIFQEYLKQHRENAQKQTTFFVNFVHTYLLTDAILINVKTPQYII